MVTANVQFARPDADARPKRPFIARGLARLLSDIDDMTPELAARAAEIESARRVPADIIDTLRQMACSGCCCHAAMAEWNGACPMSCG
jgi:hypothetical protein